MNKKNNSTDIWITTKHSGKMKGMVSINTSTLSNPFCIKQTSCTTSICSSCYAKRFESIYPSMRKKFETNSTLLSEKLLDDDKIPRLNNLYCRLHSFGELINKTHFKNFVRIAELNPQTTFALWTKRSNLVSGQIPANMKLIYSNPIKNNIIDSPPKGFDTVFNVVEKTNNTKINCNLNCINCLKCYTGSNQSIIEKQK